MSTLLKRTATRPAGIVPTICVYVALSTISVVAGWYLSGGRGLDFDVPVLYQGDGIFIISLIKRVIENPWVYSSNLLGAPFGSATYDYPIPDSGSLLALKVLGLSFGSPGAAYNAYFFLGFALNAVAAYAVMRKLRLSVPLSFVGGITFTMLPFHFMREGHLFYTWYFDAPVFTWLTIRAYRGSLDFFDKRPVRAQILDGAALLLLACFGVYFAFFGVLSILTAGLARLFRMKTARSIRGAIIATAIVFVGVLGNVAPTIIYRHTHAPDLEVEVRNAPDSELYGLKITQLLLPRLGHRFQPFAGLTAKYSAAFPLVTENQTATLGIIGSVGFVALLLILLAPRERGDDRLILLSFLTLVFVLFCTVGGFSALFALFISPAIRAWNRASVFVAFFSISAALLLVQQILNRIRATSAQRMATIVTAAGLCLLAMWDQTTPVCIPCSASTETAFRGDEQFVSAVERVAGKNVAIYQLPYVAFPEAPPVNKLGAYDQMIGFVHSKTLKWSFGGIKGREGDLTFRALAQQPIEQQIDIAKKMGFSGIWIERRGYEDDGKAIAEGISKKLGHGPALVSANQFFFTFSQNQ